jgi:hypothetical protein
MEVFQRGTLTSDVAIASEHLGLTGAERQLVTGQAGRTQAELWGQLWGHPADTDTASWTGHAGRRAGVLRPQQALVRRDARRTPYAGACVRATYTAAPARRLRGACAAATRRR